MTDNDRNIKQESIATPVIRKASGFSLIWLIPLITAIIGAWLIIRTQIEKGPEISITFKTADGIKAGRTKVKFKDVEVGVVQTVQFSDDLTHVMVSAKLTRGSEQLLHQGTRFWVVKPRMSLGGLSGVSTLFSGVYIELAPGKGEERTTFTGLETPPIVMPEQAGIEVMLKSGRLSSLDRGSPVYYKGLQAGKVLGYELAKDNTGVIIHAFIKQPFDDLIRSNTRFWNVSGMDISMGENGIDVHLASLKSILRGGIAFTTPHTLNPTSGAVEGLVFTLFKNSEVVNDNTLYARKSTIVAFFHGSVRGLQVGAPVEFSGIKIGTVADVSLEFDRKNASFRIPVLLTIEPGRFHMSGKDTAVNNTRLFRKMVKNGLRARLRTGSLLTGKMYVELNIFPGTPERLHTDKRFPFPEIPTLPGGMDQLTTSAQHILAKLEHVNIEKIGSELEHTLKGTNKLANSPELKESLRSLKSILHKLDQHAGPISVNMVDILKQAKMTLKLINRQLRPGSPVIAMSEELTDTARSIRALVDMLDRNPNSIIFGKPKAGE